MIISDLQHMESAGEVEVNGGNSTYTSIEVSAYGSKANVNGVAEAFGQNTGTGVLVGTRVAKGNGYELGAGTGAATAYSVTVNGKNSRVSTSVSTGVATDVKIF
ncbi:MAG: hypothetical protein RLZZ04_4800 [Cyanobacteriota bacterium]|jgi:hypothetical protein